MDQGPDRHDTRYPVHAPGWEAIDRAMDTLYPGQTPHQYASPNAYDLDGSRPLPAIGVYEAVDPLHWHYVTYGLSELFEKSSPRTDISGFGFELSFRLPRLAEHSYPPTWVLTLLQGIGHYVLSGHASLDSGHIIDLGGSLCPEPLPGSDPPQRTALEGIICVPDAQLGRWGKIDTPHGSLLFLQLFGLTRDEFEPMMNWDMERKVKLVREYDTKLLTNLARGSMREDPRKAALYRRYELRVMI